MSVRSLGHLPQTEIQAFGEQDVEQTDVVLARGAGSQVRESLSEADRRIDLEKDVRDSGGRKTAVEVKDQFFRFIRDSGGKPINPKFTVLDASMGIVPSRAAAPSRFSPSSSRRVRSSSQA